jgi:ABC-type dipeptide/oligopeptide/nickel transport system permease component
MAAYVGRRLLGALFVLWLAATIAFAAMDMAPGDPAQALLAASGATEDEIAERRGELGLDDPALQRYMRYLGNLLIGDLGQSWLHGRPVSQMILEQLPPTVVLSLAAMAVGTALGLAVGVLGAIRRGTWLDSLTTAVAVIGLSTPTYWSGLLAILLFSLHLEWLPATGQGSLRHLVLPTVVLGIALSGSIARLVRARMVEVVSEPFVTVARGLGIPTLRLLWFHVLRPALAPAIAVVALQFGFLMGGAVVTETVFARRGLGRLALEAIMWRDLPVVQGIVVLSAVIYVGANLSADILHAWLDPRLRERLT